MENGQTSLPVLLLSFQVAVSLPVGVAVGEEGQESVVNGSHLVHNVHRLCRLQCKQEILDSSILKHSVEKIRGYKDKSPRIQVNFSQAISRKNCMTRKDPGPRLT